MTFRVEGDGDGTDEAVWLACSELSQLPELAWPAPGRALVVAPHPDDEVLAVAGLMRELASRGYLVAVAAVTDGEASHPRSRTLSPSALAERRAAERSSALTRLGLGAAPAYRMGLPDGKVREASARLEEGLATLLEGATLCIAPWDRDGHPDHDAAGRAAMDASARVGCRLWQYPVWTWYWARPESAEIPWSRARRLKLSPESQRAKASAIDAYRSQIAPLGPLPEDAAILPPPVLAHFQRDFEVVFT